MTKQFWKENRNPITMYKYSSYTEELVLSRKYAKKNKKNATNI